MEHTCRISFHKSCRLAHGFSELRRLERPGCIRPLRQDQSAASKDLSVFGHRLPCDPVIGDFLMKYLRERDNSFRLHGVFVALYPILWKVLRLLHPF
jgi:hypothetical protein